MDYEKAYNEALERAKNYHDNNFSFGTTQLTEAIFPELKESEDERIRKILIHIVKGAFDKYGIKYRGDEISEEKMLAYLERQKELAVIPDELVKNYRLFCEQGGRELALLINAINGFNKLKEQKPAEWSEEDEWMIEELCCLVDSYELEEQHPEKIKHWLKSLRPQPHWKSSEEQMKHLERCFSHGHTSQLPNQHVLESLYNNLNKL